DAAGDDADGAVDGDGHDRVGGGRERLAGEDLAALQRAREDRLQRAVVILGGDDVAGDERGDEREHPDRTEEQDHERDGQAAAVDVAPEGNVVRSALAEMGGDDEQDRHQRSRTQAEVRALLIAELGELPAVDGGDAGIAHAVAASAGSGAAAPSLPSAPSVSEKNRSSRVTVWGASARISAPASISACESSATACSSAVKLIRSCWTRTSAIPG